MKSCVLNSCRIKLRCCKRMRSCANRLPRSSLPGLTTWKTSKQVPLRHLGLCGLAQYSHTTHHPLSGGLAAYYATALRLRPDLSAIENQIRAEGARIAEYRSDFFPTVHAVAGYSALGTGTPVANNYEAGIVINWPIFNGFETEHQIAEATFHREALTHQIEALRQRIYLEVKSAFLDWQASLERIKRMELTVAASRARLELATKRYDAGLGNIIELTDAERFYVEDNAGYIDALYGYAVTKAALDLASAQNSDSYKR